MQALNMLIPQLLGCLSLISPLELRPESLRYFHRAKRCLLPAHNDVQSLVGRIGRADRPWYPSFMHQ